MPTTPTYPGVYIEEVPSGVRTITGVATSITAFVGLAARGPVNEPVRITSFADFERVFGGLWTHGTMSYAVRHYFQNGGSDALVVRLHSDATRAALELPAENGGASGETITLEAANEGAWGNNLRAVVDHDTMDLDGSLFNLMVEEVDPSTEEARSSEVHRNLSMDQNAARFVTGVLEQESVLVRVREDLPAAGPDQTGSTQPAGPDSDGQVLTPVPATRPGETMAPVEPATEGSDGNVLSSEDYLGSEAEKTGIYALEKADLFNLLYIPPPTRATDVDVETLRAALEYCKKRRAMLLVDGPSGWATVRNAAEDESASGEDTGINSLRDENAAVFWPRVRMADPLKENRLEEFAPGAAVAGVFARTDIRRGVWKAPAGTEATLSGARELSVKVTDSEQGQLNPLGINCLRTLPVVGTVVWGARTLMGADRLASEWKYIPVRRLTLFVEESLYRGTQWVVFEPNDEPLWVQIRLTIGDFMQDLFRQGAFQGKTPREAYFVKCDKETTTQNDIDQGIINIMVGFAPLKPAEFVILKIQQLADQVQP